ncbi:reverse transcriptase domain-containing protein, partial [Tanacetum coccineum]
MRTRRSNYPNNSNVTIPRRRRRQVSNIVESEIQTIVTPMAERTMEEQLRAPTEGRESENPRAHINSFKRITSTLRFRNVPNDVIKLMMFPYSLEGAAKTWYEKEPPNSILTWEDLVTKFVNQFFPPSKTTHLKNEISRFTQKFEETFSEAWERFKELLRACPHHGFTELTQVDTFYNGLNENEQDSLNAAAGGNLLSKTTREALNIIENKSKVRYSRNRSNASRMNATSSKTDERIDKLADQLSTLVEIVSKKVVTPAPVKAVEESCVTCGGAHSWYNCPATDNNQASVCATTGTYNQVNPPNRVSNQMAPPGFAPVQNNGQNRFAIRIEFADALLLVPDLLLLQLEFAPRIRKVACIRLRYVEREFARDALKKLSEKSWMIRYKVFLITCNFLGMDVLSRTWPILGQRSINLIASFIWIKDFHLHRSLTPTRMTLELADRSITHPKGGAEDVFVKVRSFHFPTDFVVVDFEANPRVPLILGRSFLRSTYTGRALLIARRLYQSNVVATARKNSSSRSPENFHTIIESLPSSINLVEDSDSNREEIDIFSGPDDSIPPGIESDFNSEEDIIDNLHNDDPIPEYERLTFDMEPDVPVINNVNEDECTDSEKITRKRSKLDKHGHGNGKSAQELEESSK